MSYLSEDMPAPVASLDTEAWWEACRARDLRFQKCVPCGRLRHPPSPICPACRGADARWQSSAGRGRVYSFTWVHHPFVAGMKDRLPYNVSVVTLDDAPGVRLVTNVVDATPRELCVDLPVTLVWEEQRQLVLPRFRKA
jgi:uncharacterized OB-fold protein